MYFINMNSNKYEVPSITYMEITPWSQVSVGLPKNQTQLQVLALMMTSFMTMG